MSERQQSPYDSIAGKWLALVERRQQKLIELGNSDRWRHYYTDKQFLDEMRKVLHLRNQWARLAGAIDQTTLEQNIKQNDRRAKQYDIERSGYPTDDLLDPIGKVLERLEGYNGETSADMIAWVEKAKKK